MIELNRSKKNKWILQKNTNSKDNLLEFIKVVNNEGEMINHEDIKRKLRVKDYYHGRSEEGSSITMGVRLCQTCFYMFGYKKGKTFFPSPTTKLLTGGNKSLSLSQIALINLYSMQFPNPYSRIDKKFNIYIGRLLIKLLLDKRLDEKLYIDEGIYFLMFLEEINKDSYEELVKSILLFRDLTFKDKEKLFKSVEEYDNVFANTTHEFKTYFVKLFTEFGVFDCVEDEEHNEGNLLRFYHGKSRTPRNDKCINSNKKCSGYIIINEDVKEDAKKLNQQFSAFDAPITQADSASKFEWILELYEFTPLKYIEILIDKDDDRKYIVETVRNMVYNSSKGSVDGKSFELSLQPVFEMFREINNVDYIGGSGDTDLLCNINEDLGEFNKINVNTKYYKINVDAKTAKKRTSQLNPARLSKHIFKNGSQYCIVVSSHFSKGAKEYISGYNIVSLEAETLASYCLNECLSGDDQFADFDSLDIIIKDNLGTDITKKVKELIEIKFEVK